MVAAGLERRRPGVGLDHRRANDLLGDRLCLAAPRGDCAGAVRERVKGIEPSSVAWKATALPLSYTRAPVKSAVSWRGCQAIFGARLLSVGPDLDQLDSITGVPV